MNNTTNLIEVGGLYKTTEHGCILVYKFDKPYLSEFRMKSGYVFTILETNVKFSEPYLFAKILMSNTGNLQLLHMRDLEAFLDKQFIVRIA